MKPPMCHFRYNPHWQEPDELKRLFVARKPLLERLHAQIAEQGTTSVPRHHLIIGQRGMGKTTLLARLALELRNQNPEFLPLTFWEEQHVEVDRLSVFWLNCLDSLADALDRLGNKGLADEIDGKVRRLEALSDEEERAREAAECFQAVTQSTGKRLVLFIDNFNLLMGRLKAHDHVLRGFFTRHGAPIIIGAGITPPDDISDYDAAFYDGFQTTLLHRLSQDEVREMIRRLAEDRDEPQAIHAMLQALPRVSALRDLSGGNPRTCLLIYRLCVQGFTESIYHDLETLLDETTPLFQSRFEQLSDQGQKLVARLARHWRPATAETITELTGFPRGTVSPLLGRLEQEGIVEKVQLFDAKRREPLGKTGALSKRPGYQIAERFFCIWLIMRASSRRERDTIRCLSRWLECLYTPEELKSHAAKYSGKRALDWNQAIVARALADCMSDESAADFHDLRLSAEISLLSFVREGSGSLEGVLDEKEINSRCKDFVTLRARLMERVGTDDGITPEEFADLVLGSPSILIEGGYSRRLIAALDQPGKMAIGNIVAELQDIQKSFREQFGETTQTWLCSRLSRGLLHVDGDTQNLEAALKAAPSAAAKACVGALAHEHEHMALAEKAYKAALHDDQNVYHAWAGLAQIYHKGGRFEEARGAYVRALAIDDTPAEICANYARLLAVRFDQLAEAEPWFRKASQRDLRNATKANDFAFCLWYQGGREKCEEAIREFRRAAALDMSEPKYHIHIGNIYQDEFKDYAKAETSYRTAISMTSKAPKARWFLADLLHYSTGNYKEAEQQYRKAIADGCATAGVWFNLGILLIARLDQPEAAKEAFLKALEIEPHHANALNSLGNLLYDSFGDFAAAASYFDEALAADSNADQARHNAIFLHRDTLGDMARAKNLFAELRQPDQWKDTQSLHRALFACYEDNWGLAAESLKAALEVVNFGAFPKNTEDDWFRASAVMLKLGFGVKLLSFLESNGWENPMMPWYAALEAHQAGDSRLLLNYPPEVRSAAEVIYAQIEKRKPIMIESS